MALSLNTALAALDHRHSEVDDASLPIRLIAQECCTLFRAWEMLAIDNLQHEEAKLRLEYRGRFEAWAAFLGTFAEGENSLDYRLRHQPCIQDSVMRLLNILRIDLALGDSIYVPTISDQSP